MGGGQLIRERNLHYSLIFLDEDHFRREEKKLFKEKGQVYKALKYALEELKRDPMHCGGVKMPANDSWKYNLPQGYRIMYAVLPKLNATAVLSGPDEHMDYERIRRFLKGVMEVADLKELKRFLSLL